jgi:excisionase family DNA binding protein
MNDTTTTALPMLLDAAQLCGYLGIGKDTLQELIDAGMPVWHPAGRKPGARRLFHRGAVEDWARAQSEAERRGAKAVKARAPKGPKAARLTTGDGPIVRADGSYDLGARG